MASFWVRQSEQAVSSPQRGLLFTHNLIGNFKRNYPNCSLVFTFLWLSKARKISANYLEKMKKDKNHSKNCFVNPTKTQLSKTGPKKII